jgi:hypothetical protein
LTTTAVQHAQKYLKRSLESQKRLGYSTRVDGKTYDSAVADAARAVARLLKAQERRAA